MKRIVLALGLCVATTQGFSSQELKVDPEQRYLLLAATKTSTMEKELSAAAALGFRVIAASPTSGAEMVLFLERTAKPPDTYQYRLLATTKTGTAAKELAEAAAQGFRLIPQSAIAKDSVSGKMFGAPRELVIVLERAPGALRRYEYKLLATSKTSTMQKEVADAVTAGFSIVGIVSRDEHMVIMEKELAAGS
jgi:hypothetical protein